MDNSAVWNGRFKLAESCAYAEASSHVTIPGMNATLLSLSLRKTQMGRNTYIVFNMP